MPGYQSNRMQQNQTGLDDQDQLTLVEKRNIPILDISSTLIISRSLTDLEFDGYYYFYSRMSEPTLLKNAHQLKTGQADGDLLQETVVYNNSTILLVFEKNYQLWDIKENKMLYETKSDDRVFYWTNNTFMDESNIVFISYEIENQSPYLGEIDLKTSKVNKLAHLPKQEYENYEKLVLVKTEKGVEVVISNASKSAVLVYSDGKIEQVTLEGAGIIDTYNNQDTYVAYNNSYVNQTVQYTLVKNGEKTIHNTKIKSKDLSIKTIKQYSESKSVIVCAKGEVSSIYLYNHEKGVVEDTDEVKFNVEYIIQKNEGKWIACRTAQGEESYVEIQSLFTKDSSVLKRMIPDWTRVETDCHAGFVAKSENGVTSIETIELVKQESVYIHMMEKMGIITDFGNEIVKAVINNLF